MSRIKIVRVIARLNIGGPAIQAIELTARLDPAVFDSMLVAGREAAFEGNMLDLAAARGVRPVILPRLGREISVWNDALVLWKLWRLFRRERPRIVHTHTAKAGMVGRLAARLAGVPVVVHTFHGHVFRGYFGRAKSRFFVRVERILARFTDRIVVLSERQKDDLVSLGIAPPGKFEIVPLGFDLAPFLEARGADFRRELGSSGGDGGGGEALVGIVGRLTAVKDHRMFLRAAVRIVAVRPDVRFVVVGDGELRKKLEAFAAGLGLGGKVIFTGWRRDMPRVYASLDVVALTSLNEGTPVSLIEAMAAGKPAAATDVGGVADVVEDGVTGFLARAGDDAAFAAIVLKLLGDREAAGRMGEAGRRKAAAGFTVDRLTADVACLYLALLAEKDAGSGSI